ncbi:MAG: DUF2163 domain-containing protein [Pseudomonadota bacterium]
MAGFPANLQAHAATGHTTLCHAWAVHRADGVSFGFTDHDLPLAFEGMTFLADSGLAAKALSQTTGLSVDNTEALGALSAECIREDEIEQGRFDGAEVMVWLVNWANVAERWLQFRGSIGQITRAGGAFKAELRGLTEALNVPQGRVYQRGCTPVLGDVSCQDSVDLPIGAFSIRLVEQERDGRVFTWSDGLDFDSGWLVRGRFEVLEGPSKGLWGVIKFDRSEGAARTVELWEPIRGDVGPGTQVKLYAGCENLRGACDPRFGDLTDYDGFPDLPNDDWSVAVPRTGGANSGGSRR